MAPSDSRRVNRCGHGHLACKFPINVTVPLAGGIEEDPCQQARRLCGRAVGPADPVAGENGLNIIPQPLIDDCLMFARIALVLVDNLTAVDAVLEQVVEGTHGDRFAAVGAPIRGGARLADNARSVEALLECPD